jgi:deoxyribose-phosphate aldolase
MYPIGIENKEVVKWIIEVAALKERQIIELSALVRKSGGF